MNNLQVRERGEGARGRTAYERATVVCAVEQRSAHTFALPRRGGLLKTSWHAANKRTANSSNTDSTQPLSQRCCCVCIVFYAHTLYVYVMRLVIAASGVLLARAAAKLAVITVYESSTATIQACNDRQVT